MRLRRKAFINACVTAVLIGFIWRVLEIMFYGSIQPRVVDDVIWMILLRYIYQSEWRRMKMRKYMEKDIAVPCIDMRDKAKKGGR